MTDFVFSLTEQESNFLLSLLAKAPYEQVFQLIAKMQGQAVAQLNERQALPLE